MHKIKSKTAHSSDHHSLFLSRVKGPSNSDTVTSLSFTTKTTTGFPPLLSVAFHNARVVYFYDASQFLEGKKALLAQLNIKDDYMSSVAVSNDGSFLAVGIEGKQTLRIYTPTKNSKTGKIEFPYTDSASKCSNPIDRMQISKNCQVIISISREDTETRIWNKSGQLVQKLDTKQVKNNEISISGDSRFFGIGTWLSSVRIYEIDYDKKSTTYKDVIPVMTLSGHTSKIYCLSFSEDGKRVVTGSNDETWKLWDIDVRYKERESTSCLNSTDNPNKKSYDLAALNPQGNLVALVSVYDIQLWNTENYQLVDTIVGAHTQPITSLVWSTDGKVFATGSKDGTVAVWKSPTM